MTKTKPRTFRSSETGGYCEPPRVHLDRYIDDKNINPGKYNDAIWDANADEYLGDWIWANVSPARFEELLIQRAIVDSIEEDNDDLIDVNEKGGRQSKLETRFDLVPFSALYEAAKILKTGAEKYGVDNWRRIPAEDHVNHALEHLYRHLEIVRLGLQDEEDDYDLGHALVRLMFAVAIDNDGEID